MQLKNELSANNDNSDEDKTIIQENTDLYARLEDLEDLEEQDDDLSKNKDDEEGQSFEPDDSVEMLSAQGLQLGDSGDEVLQLQLDLQTLGFLLNHTVTNTFDVAVKEQVVRFQNYYGLSETGVADDTTLAKISEILDTPLRNGGRHEDAIQLKNRLIKLGVSCF
ncbi:MAG: peptidoglycan-binding protein [Bacillaceae bacterium]|nr:peptidoglycan-binding protein [Bacillaceae bacterium]